MKYYICEGKKTGEYNASSKARIDAEKILEKNGYKSINVETKYGVRENKFLKIFQYLDYNKNYYIWKKFVKNLTSNDHVIIQYPLLNVTLNFEKIVRMIKSKCSITILIHDMDSLRYKPEINGKRHCKRVNYEDKTILKEATNVICHNYKMKEELLKIGVKSNIYELQIFDYLYNKNEINNRKYSKEVIIAGRLAQDKAPYIGNLNSVKKVKFNLYGEGYKEDSNSTNISYKGRFLPEELISNLKGGFGLVWDGNSIQSCCGGYGEYLKYNNPHKTSMYLAANLPVIMWEEAALAKFVIDNKIGFVVKSLNEIEEKLNGVTASDYDEMLKNIEEISNDIRNGKMLEKVLEKIEMEKK